MHNCSVAVPFQHVQYLFKKLNVQFLKYFSRHLDVLTMYTKSRHTLYTMSHDQKFHKANHNVQLRLDHLGKIPFLKINFTLK